MFSFRYDKLLKSFYTKLFNAYIPLLKLTKKNIPWLWTHKHQNVFNDLKTELISPKVMSYYDPSLNALIFKDASPVGVSAILF